MKGKRDSVSPLRNGNYFIFYFVGILLLSFNQLAYSNSIRPYFNEKYRFSFEYPSTWEMKEYHKAYFNDYTISLTNNNGQINLSAGEGIEKNYQQYYDITKIPNIKKNLENQIISGLGNVKNIKVEFTKLANRNAIVADFLFAKVADKTTLFFKVKQYTLFNKGNQYTVSIKCPGHTEKETKEKFKLIEKEIKIILISFAVY